MSQYLFIDGACLRSTIENFKERYGYADISIGWNWPAIISDYDKVFYYDALPGRRKSDSGEVHELRRLAAEELHDKLQGTDRVHVYEGDARWRSGRGHEQKKVDVMIAVDMLKHTIRKNMQRAALYASDVDFKPLLDALVDEGMFTTLIHPIHNAAKDLLRSADARRAMTYHNLINWLDSEARSKIEMVSPLIHWGSSGPVLETWTVSSGENVEVRQKLANEGGYERSPFQIQWLTKDGAMNSLQGSSIEMLKKVASNEHGVKLIAS